MFGKFFYGQLSLSEAFWKFCVLGLAVSGFLARIFMILLKQTLNYDPNFLRVVISSLSFIHSNVKAMTYFACYSASFIALVVYSIICIIGMWRTYKEYDKSKTLAIICMLIVWAITYFAVRFAIY